MLEKIKKNINEWYLHSLGVMLLAVAVVLNGNVEVSFALYGLSIVLMGIGALYNQGQKLDKILDNQKLILDELLKAKDE